MIKPIGSAILSDIRRHPNRKTRLEFVAPKAAVVSKYNRGVNHDRAR